MRKLTLVLLSLMVVACSTAPKKDASLADQAGSEADAAARARLAGKGAWNGSVYFEFGTAVITPEYAAAIQKEAVDIIGQEKKVALEGNCDERGSDEYNLGLGQRRADVVKKLLVTAGVHDHRVKANSLGEEKPRLKCHDESCWKENRRVDFVQDH